MAKVANRKRRATAMLVLLTVLTVLAGCRGGYATDERLLAVDSIVDRDSVAAWQRLQAIDSASLTTDADRALYALLHQQLRYKQYLSLDTTVLNRVLQHFTAHPSDNHSYAVRATMLKGSAAEDEGNILAAIECYKRAEVMTDTADWRNMAQVNMRLGHLYYDNFANHNLAVPKFERARHYYKLLGDSARMLYTMDYLGALYRIDKHDEAHDLMDETARLAMELGDTAIYVSSRVRLSRCLLNDSLPLEAKRVMVACIQGFKEHIPNDGYYNASMAYAAIGMPDSARYYLACATPDTGNYGKHMETTCLMLIAEAEKHYDAAYRYSHETGALADTLLKNTSTVKLATTEARVSENVISELKQGNNQLSRYTRRLMWLIAVVLAMAAAMGLYRHREGRKRVNVLRHQLVEQRRELDDRLEEQKRLIEKRHTTEMENVKRANEQLRSHLDEIEQNRNNNEHFTYQFMVEYIALMRDLLHASETNSPLEFQRQFAEFYKDFVRNHKSFWVELRHYTNREYHGFSDKIRNDYPQLAEDELRLLELMRCDFSYIEIAILMNYKLSYMSRKRQRIARKMGLRGSLIQYFQEN